MNGTFGRRLLLVLFAFLAVGCSAAQVRTDPAAAPPKKPVEEVVKEDVTYAIDAYDPWEGMNRRIYKFNAKFDKYVYLPVVNAYRFITPGFVRTGVSNFFSNLNDVNNLANSFLQFKGNEAATTAFRIVVNSTVGLAGLVDVATNMGIKKHEEDFGQTLGFYCVATGPYLVLPILGPSTLRDTGGLVVDGAGQYALRDEIIDQLDMDDSEEAQLKGGVSLLNAIDTRHQQEFRYYETGSPFEYDLIRMLYLQKRELQIGD